MKKPPSKINGKGNPAYQRWYYRNVIKNDPAMWEARKERIRRHRLTEKGLATQRQNVARYIKSPKGQAALKKRLKKYKKLSRRRRCEAMLPDGSRCKRAWGRCGKALCKQHTKMWDKGIRFERRRSRRYVYYAQWKRMF